MIGNPHTPAMSKQAVAYADALIVALAGIAPNPPDLSPGS